MDQAGQVRTNEHRSNSLPDCSNGDMTCQVHKTVQHKPEDKTMSNEYESTCKGTSMTSEEYISEKTCKTCRLSGAMWEILEGIATIPKSVMKKKDKMKTSLQDIFPVNKSNVHLNESSNSTATVLFEGRKEHRSTTVSDFRTSGMTCIYQDKNQHTPDEKRTVNEESSSRENGSLTAKTLGSGPEATPETPDHDRKSQLLSDAPHGSEELSGDKKKKKHIQRKIFKTLGIGWHDDKLGGTVHSQNENSRNKEQSLNTVSDCTNGNVICTQQDENQHTSDESSSTEDGSTCETGSRTPQNIGSSPEKTIDIPNGDKRPSLLPEVPSLTKALSEVKKKKKKIKKKIQKKLFQSHKNSLSDSKLGNADSYQEENCNKSVAILLEETKDLISQQRFAEASRHLIDLEHKVYSNTEDEDQDADTLKKEQADVELTYEVLYKEVITTLNDMLNVAQTNSNLLENAVKTIVQEEQEDETCAKDQEGHMSASPARPRKWKEKFLTSLNHIVIARLSEDPCLISGNERLSSFAQHFNCIGRKVKQDLITVVTHVKKCFPQDYDICNVFARYVHDHFSSQMTNITDFVLQKKDIHCILCWVLNIYPNDILNNSILANDVHGNALGKLLPESKIQELEAGYVNEEMNDVIIWLQKSLSIEKDRWIKGNLPERLDGCYHSELPIDVLQNFYGARDRAKEIKPKLEETMSQRLLAEFSQFLERYKKSLDEFKEKCSHQENYIPVIITNINNCLHFRKYLEQCSADSDMEDKIISLKILNNIEEDGLKLLESLLSQKLKQHYKKLVKDKWRHESESMDNILTSTDDYLLDIKGLKEPYFQDLLRKIHLNIVVEYIRRLMKKKVSFKSPVQQQKMADEIMQHASEIKCLFEKYGSKATFLYEAVLKLSEVIRLQDVCAIQVEVASLAHDYGDIRKEHVAAVLYIKANLSKSSEKSILKILNVSKEAVPSDTQELFSHIAVS